MTAPSDKLPKWPEWRGAMDVDEALEYQTALTDAWESRCRLAVEALGRASELLHQGFADDSEKIDTALPVIDNNLDAIGPLPERDP